MEINRLEECRGQRERRKTGLPVWHRMLIKNSEDMQRFIRIVTTGVAAGFAEREVHAVRLALDEAITNAHKHGHEGDWSKPIAVQYYISADGVVAQVKDRGAGFDPQDVPDPTIPENLERNSGRGLFLMRTFVSRVCHNRKGDRVCFCKHFRPRDAVPHIVDPIPHSAPADLETSGSNTEMGCTGSPAGGSYSCSLDQGCFDRAQ